MLTRKRSFMFLVLCITLISSTVRVFAIGESGKTLMFSNLDVLLWSVVKTIQYYTLPIMTIALVLLGIKLVSSGDDTNSKEVVKSWMVKILIGGVIIFGAVSLASLIKDAIS